MTEAKLLPVGFFSDTEIGEASQPSLVESIGKPSEWKDEVLRYLKAAHVMITAGVGLYDELSPGRELVGAYELQTDGVWVWPRSYSFYVERYDAEIPKRLLELASSRNWTPPAFSDDADFDDRIPFS
ncbi:hypothetical protein [Streptomyces sp. A1547]|uniref:hypothetical protein n=1 Tax=Streptomyces sp. A1547 TaxID=2563105 RepID=UPI00109E7B17|nr:hypothetical protein [Streptomyces sp. A1547]THA33012.1 hypothetical protein E6W17_32050 [Streptomyces sp. A1547]